MIVAVSDDDRVCVVVSVAVAETVAVRVCDGVTENDGVNVGDLDVDGVLL